MKKFSRYFNVSAFSFAALLSKLDLVTSIKLPLSSAFSDSLSA